jgi:hypothetical protein
MTNEHKRYYVAAGFIFVALTLLAASWYIKTQQGEYRDRLYTALTEQENTMLNLSTLIDRDEADEAVAQIVKDCSVEERQQFDTLLSSLSELNRQKLQEVNGLFDMCSHFYADRQAILAMRLNRELETYEEYVALLALTDSDVEEYTARTEQWQKLSQFEHDRSRLAAELVDLQGVIIDLLVSGKSVDSEEILNALQDAQVARVALVTLNTEADELRKQLSEL